MAKIACALPGMVAGSIGMAIYTDVWLNGLCVGPLVGLLTGLAVGIVIGWFSNTETPLGPDHKSTNS